MIYSTITIDTWELNGRTLHVQFRSTATDVQVTVSLIGQPGDADAARFASLGAAERWYVRYATQLARLGARRLQRTVREEYGGRSPFADLRGSRHASALPPRPKPATETDPYRLLGVYPGVREDDLRTAYRRLALLWHPDRCDAPDAQERMGAINRAYDHVRQHEGMGTG